MYTKIIRILVVMLVAFIVIGAVGCGGGADQTPSTPTATPTPTPTTPMPTPTPAPAQAVPSGIEMVSIPGGTFSMGSPAVGDIDESPVHSVTLSPFQMSAYEVTYAQWMKVRSWAEANGYTFNMPGGKGSEDDRGTQDDGGMQDENHPVTTIEWYDAVLWSNALSEMEGRTPFYYTSYPSAARSTVYRGGSLDIQNDWVDWTADGYRLPTEAEWEYASRAGTATEYSFGNSITGSDANYLNSGDAYDNGTAPVGSYAANAWGLYDVHGNVGEWAWDWYDPSYYSDSPSSDPRGSALGPNRVLRGGGWDDYPEYLRSAYRGYGSPADGYVSVGFRPVLSQ